MRRSRLTVGPESIGTYHCVSRIVDKRKVLRTAEKEQFRSLMRELEAFCEVRVVTYAIMSNHFHILLQVPPRPEVLPSPEELLVKLAQLSCPVDLDRIRDRIQSYRKTGDQLGLEAYLETFYRRMWDLSEFMKQLKQRFTQWFNAKHHRKGTLWESRFKSILIEGRGLALAAVAAYIDLNPVRAGITADPSNYRWCGYAEALAGKRRSREGVRIIINALTGKDVPSFPKAHQVYARLLGGKFRQRPRLSHTEALQVLEDRGRLLLGDFLRGRIRYFTDGLAIGSNDFIEKVFFRSRSRFSSQRRKGARRLKGVENADLYCLRDLRLRVFE
jgi:putative transposase